jgi:hypothetical protein
VVLGVEISVTRLVTFDVLSDYTTHGRSIQRRGMATVRSSNL